MCVGSFAHPSDVDGRARERQSGRRDLRLQGHDGEPSDPRPVRHVDLTITECTTAKVTALDSTKPTVTIKSTASNILIIGPETINGRIGWCIDPLAQGHELRSVEPRTASGCGILDRGGMNKISFNSATGNAVGVCIGAANSEVRGGTVEDNGPASPAGATSGIALAGSSSSNEVRGARCGVNIPNTAADICDGGTGNLIVDNRDCAVAHTRPPARSLAYLSDCN